MPPLRQCLSSGPNFTLRNYQLFRPNSQISAVDRPWTPTVAVQSILHSSARSIIKARQTFTARLQLSSLTDEVHHFTEVTDNLKASTGFSCSSFMLFFPVAEKEKLMTGNMNVWVSVQATVWMLLSYHVRIKFNEKDSSVCLRKHKYYIIYSLQIYFYYLLTCWLCCHSIAVHKISAVNIVYIFQEHIYHIQTASSLPTKVQKSLV